MGLTKFRQLSAFLVLFFFLGCSTLAGIKQKESFTNISSAYRKAILWSDFEYASTFLKNNVQNEYRQDFIYQNIKVTAYDEKRYVINPDMNKIEQTVSIHYYWIDRMVEKNITEHLVWEWDFQSKNWYLTSGLPKFK